MTELTPDQQRNLDATVDSCPARCDAYRDAAEEAACVAVCGRSKDIRGIDPEVRG